MGRTIINVLTVVTFYLKKMLLFLVMTLSFLCVKFIALDVER